MPVVALTGATGFIGRATLARLLRSEAMSEVRVLVRGAGRLGAPHDRRVDVAGDLGDRDALDRLVDGADAVIHLAGAIAGSHEAEFHRVNSAGSRRLAQAIADRAPDAHALLVSSLAASHPELSWYASSKAGAEQAWREVLGRRATVLRPPAVYGPEDPALADFWSSLARGWLIRLGPSAAKFSLVHVDDVVEAVVRILDHGPIERLLTLAGPQPEGGWRWQDIAEVAARVRGRSIRTLAVPSPVLRLAGRLALTGQRLRGRPALLSPGKVRELRHVDWVCDNLALSAHLHWEPSISLERALTTLPGWNAE